MDTLYQGHEKRKVGKGGLGEVNEAGERWLDFCLDHELSLSNTEHAHHPRCLYTWTSPDGKARNQIDYIAIERKSGREPLETASHIQEQIVTQ